MKTTDRRVLSLALGLLMLGCEPGGVFGPPAAVAPPAVTVQAVSPSSGPLAGGTAVLITATITGGEAFAVRGHHDLSGSYGDSVESVRIRGVSVDWGVVTSAAGATPGTYVFTATTPVGGAVGPVDVTIATSRGGSDTCASCFRYNPALAVGRVSPDNGPIVGGTALTINLDLGPVPVAVAVDSVRLGAVLLINLTRVSDILLTGTAPAGAAAGPVDITLYGGDSVSTRACTGCFTYNPTLVVIGLTPGRGLVAGGTSLKLTMASFGYGSVYASFDSIRVGTGWLTSMSRVSARELTGSTPPAAAPGPVDVTVYGSSNVGSVTCVRCFIYDAPVAVTSVTPSHGALVGGTPVVVSGTSLPAAIDSVRIGVKRLTTVLRVSSTTLTGTTPVGAAAGVVDVIVYLGGVAPIVCAGCFTYDAAASDTMPPPTLLLPAEGAHVSQNDHAVACGDNATRGYGFRLAFSWSAVSAASGPASYRLYVKRLGSAFPLIDATVADTVFVQDFCNAFVTDVNLTGWEWSIRAVYPDSTSSPVAGPRNFGFLPCRLGDGRPCYAP